MQPPAAATGEHPAPTETDGNRFHIVLWLHYLISFHLRRRKRPAPPLTTPNSANMINPMVNYCTPPPAPPARPEADLDAIFKALAHPARRTMLERLGRGEATVGELAGPLGMSAPAVTKHIRVLARAKLITQGRHARWRPCRLEEAPLRSASYWLEEVRRLWDARLDRLEAHLQSMATPEEGNRDDEPCE